MFKNYIKVAIRNLLRNKLYSVISIISLSIGIACCLIIFALVKYEFTFDNFHQNGSNIYRVIQGDEAQSEISEGTVSTTFPLRAELRNKFPEVKYASRICAFNTMINRENNSFYENVVMVDSDFFNMFSFPFKQGNAGAIINNPQSVVITDEMAQKYFGAENPLGKSLKIQLNETPLDFEVSGIINKAPVNSSIQFDFLISAELLKYTQPEEYLSTWNIVIFPTYIQLDPGTDLIAFEKKISTHVNELYMQEGEKLKYKLQPVSDIHTNPSYEGETIASINPTNVYILGTIAVAILLIACINFITLTIGRITSRIREVGLRKVIGAQRSQVIRQFWIESLLLSTLALLVGIMIAEIFLPVFNELAQKQLSLNLFTDESIIITSIGLILLTSIIAGFYPAMYLSKFAPIEILRSNLKIRTKNFLIHGLIVLQFAISIFLIFSTIVMSSQIDYIGNTKLGYNKDSVVTIRVGETGEAAADLTARFRSQLVNQPSIIDITGYAFPIGQSWLYLNLSSTQGATFLIGEDITRPGYASNALDTSLYFYLNWVDPYYIPAMKINVTRGRNFMDNHTADKEGAIIINQTMADKLGYDDPIGKKLPRGFQNAAIVGVIEDFHFYPLHRSIEPLVLHLPRNDNMGSINEIAVRINTNNITETLSLLENTWSQVSNNAPFEYQFLDEKVANQYNADQRWRKIVTYSSLMSLLITCIGLFGLASLAVIKRFKEIGIRKVLGATTGQIVFIFTYDFIKYVFIALLIALPLAYIVMNNWLENFATRMSLSWFIFVLSGLAALVIAIFAVGYQSIRAATTNPVDAIKCE